MDSNNLENTADEQRRLLLKEQALTAIQGGVLITDPNLPGNPILYANPGFMRMTGYTEQEISTYSKMC